MYHRLNDFPRVSAYVSLVFTGAIFGFFYAWVCSTMWGLDRADPRVAIEAMQEMNDSVQNAVFFPAFFLTPVVLVVTGAIARRRQHPAAATWFFAAAAVYTVGAMVLTLTVNVPMNDDLADTAIPASLAEAEQVWDDYSQPWQRWNAVRTVASAASLVLAGVGLAAMGRPDRAVTDRDVVAADAAAAPWSRPSTRVDVVA
jgi:uncharacterized membrane protein